MILIIEVGLGRGVGLSMRVMGVVGEKWSYCENNGSKLYEDM